MTNTYKATPECWEWQEKWASKEVPDEDSSCFLELRARVEALEDQASNYPAILDSSIPPTVATDEDLRAAWNVPGTNLDAFRAIYNLGIKHGQASSREVAAPAPVAGGLVERVKLAIEIAEFDLHAHQWDEARAAILEAAKWLREQALTAAALLEQEAGQ